MYIHFYYLIIVIAGLWYGRRAILIAIIFGMLHITDTYLLSGMISPDALICACMFAVMALIAGMTKEQSDTYRDQLDARNHELEDANNRLASSQNAFDARTGNSTSSRASPVTTSRTSSSRCRGSSALPG